MTLQAFNFRMINRRTMCFDCASKKLLLFLLVLCCAMSTALNDCPAGYQPRGLHNSTCTDINECIEGGYSQCGQLCTNTPGSFRCSCLPGYVLEADRWSCYAQDLYIMFSHGQEISRMDQGGRNLSPVLQGTGEITSFDYHYTNRLLYWIEERQKMIGVAPIDGGQSSIVLSNLKRPHKIAVDWIHHKIYWTDLKTKQIERASLGGMNREIIVQTGHRKPICIAVDPFQGYIFLSTSGKRPRLERSDLNGSNHHAILTDGVMDVVSITLDIIDRRLFWLDNLLRKIQSVDYNGRNLEVVRSELSNELGGLSLFTDHIYWTELTNQSLSQANKYTGQDLVMLRTTYLETPSKSISVVHPLRQPLTDPTDAINCSTDGDCPLDIPAGEPAEAKPFLVITNQHDIQRINLDGSNYVQVAAGNMTNLVAVDYDIREKMVYYADQGRALIGRVGIDGRNREVVVSPDDIDVIEGIAIDWIHRRLYWTDSGRQTISTCSIYGGSIQVILDRDLQHPKAIAVHPALNLVYWSDVAQPAKIEAVRHDGSHRVTVATTLTKPNSLAIDYLNNKLIWLDTARLTIEMSNLDGTSRSVVSDRNLGQPVAVAEFGNYVWFTDWEQNIVVQADKMTGVNHVRLRGMFNQPSGIQVIHPSSKKIGRINPCMVFNGGCEQICLVAHENQVICSCDAGYRLRPDGISCSMDECYTRQAQCHPHAICLDTEEGYDCHCEPGYVGNGYHCFAPTTPPSQLIAAPAVTFYPTVQQNPATTPNQRLDVGIPTAESGFEPTITMSTKEALTRKVGVFISPRRSTTAAPLKSTTGPPGSKARKPNGPNGHKPIVETAPEVNNGSATNSGGMATNRTSSVNDGGNQNKSGNNGLDTTGLGNLFPGVAGEVTLGAKPTIPLFGICPSEYKYYCLNGGTCSWLIKLQRPSCRCPVRFTGERCLWTRRPYNAGINGVTVAAISGGILLPLIIFVLIVAFLLCKKKKKMVGENIRRASRPEITLQPVSHFGHFNQSPSSQNNSASGSSFCSGSRRSSICTALISGPLDEAETSLVEPHTTAAQTRSDPTSPGSPSMVKAIMTRLSDPSGALRSTVAHQKLLNSNHYQVPKKSNPAIMPKPTFMQAGGVAALARRQSQSESQENEEEHMYSSANLYVEMNTKTREKSIIATMPRLSQAHKYMAMDEHYSSTSLGRRKMDTHVLYVNTPKKSFSASQFDCV